MCSDIMKHRFSAALGARETHMRTHPRLDPESRLDLESPFMNGSIEMLEDISEKFSVPADSSSLYGMCQKNLHS